MTPAAIAELVDAAALPRGYSLQVTTQRKHPLRSLWNVRIFRGDERVWGRAFYNVAAGIVVASATAWAISRENVPLTVTTDADGYITSMEPTE